MSAAMSCKEADNESPESSCWIVINIFKLLTDIWTYIPWWCIRETFDIIRSETIVFDSLLEFVSPLSSFWHVMIHIFIFQRTFYMPLWKLRKFSQLVVVDVVDDYTDPLVGLIEATYHSRIVKNLWSPFDWLWKGSEEVQGLGHYEYLFTTKGFLFVRGPSIELVCGVWEQNAFIFGLSLLYDLEKLRSNFWCGRDTFIGWASKN